MISLRPYQLQLVDEARQALRSTKRLLIQAACGAGKTCIASYIIESAASKKLPIMFIVHRNELLLQASRTMKNFGIEHGFIAAHYTPKKYCNVQIAMIDTLRNRLDKVTVPKLLIIDEAHHAISPTWKKIIQYYCDKGTVIIGLSATPQRLDGRPLNDMFDQMVCGPDIKSLINAGSLSRYKYYAPPSVVDMEGVKKKFGDYDQKEQSLRVDKPHVFGDAIEHYKKILHGKRAIAFQINIQASKNFAAQCIAQGIPCLHVDGEMSSVDRAKSIKSFEDGHTWILSNVGLFGEGFDVSACDGVILLRKTASLSLYLQMCGRMMRPYESKDIGIILDHMNNISLHGLPDADREWSLEGQKSKDKKKLQEVVAIRQCPKCYHVFESGRMCPQCGHDLGAQYHEIEKIDGELQEIKQDDLVKLEKKKEVGKARTLQDLNQIALDRGYKNGWARKVFESRARRH